MVEWHRVMIKQPDGWHLVATWPGIRGAELLAIKVAENTGKATRTCRARVEKGRVVPCE